MGYERPSITSQDGSTFIDNTPELRSSVYLTVFVTVEPFVATGSCNTAHLECTELTAVTVSSMNKFNLKYGIQYS